MPENQPLGENRISTLGIFKNCCTLPEHCKTNSKMKKVFLLLSATLSVIIVDAQDVLFATGNTSITVDKNANMYVGGGVSLEDKSSIHNDGTILIAKNNAGKADFMDNTSTAYNYGTGSFIFSGPGMQNVKTSSRFGVLEVDNKGLNLLSDISSDKWDLKNGVVNTGAYYAIAAASQTSWFTADEDNSRFSKSWINGNLRQYISPANVNNYVLPVGDAYRVKVCEMDNLSRNPLTGVQYVNVSFARPQGWYVNATENEMKYKSVNNAGMWSIIPDAKPVSGSYDLKLSVADFPGLWDNRFGVLNRSDADWAVPAGSSMPADGNFGRTVAGGFAQRNNVKVFNQFAVASMDMLPVDAAASYKVYPDPVINNEFFIQVKNYQLNGFKMFTADGKEISVSSVTRKDGQVKVNLPVSFTKGSYIVQLDTNKGFRTAKIIVQ
jgi:hypothetical protein